LIIGFLSGFKNIEGRRIKEFWAAVMARMSQGASRKPSGFENRLNPGLSPGFLTPGLTENLGRSQGIFFVQTIQFAQCPLQKVAHFALFLFGQMWTIEVQHFMPILNFSLEYETFGRVHHCPISDHLLDEWRTEIIMIRVSRGVLARAACLVYML
jgi:hypothetical protein